MKRLKLYLKKFMRYLEYPAAFFEKYAYFQINTTDEEIPWLLIRIAKNYYIFNMGCGSSA
jgi:hypothetical protein